jgi:Ser/Thr protein kinase RdoA (MazF antagonist)
MDGTLVAPDWPALTPAEVRRLLDRFTGLRGPLEILTVSPRPFSAAGLVKTVAGPIFVKRHARQVRDREGLAEEHRFMAYLREHGAAVPRVFADAEGLTAIEEGEWTWEVHEVAPEFDLYGEAFSWTPFRCARHAHAAGEAMARMHLAAEGFNAVRRKTQPLVASFTIFAAEDPTGAMKEYFVERPSLAGHARVRACADKALELLAPFHARLRPLLTALDPLWTHNDLHASNLLWSDSTDAARATAIIDFGLADRATAVHDIAHAIERNIVEWLALVAEPDEPDKVPIHFDHLEAMLAGYESVRSFTPSERAALAPMTAICHAEFALSEADYFAGILKSEQKARMAYEGWLVGHARWFHSEAGLRLLDAIDRFAHTHAGAEAREGAAR